MEPLRLAILDMYDGHTNQGMRCIKEIVGRFEDILEWRVFDVRGKAEVPDLSYNIYISTGGPGSPLEGDGIWDVAYYQWLQRLWDWNRKPDNTRKYAFFICHSFQMAVHHFKVAVVNQRKSTSFGTFPCHMTDAGAEEKIFDGLPNPFYIADFRDWQCVQPNLKRIDHMGARILALEKIRAHVPYERAIMALRFSDEMIGVQFHPEADPDGMLAHFLDPQRRETIILDHGEDKYLNMIDHLNDSDKIGLTHEIVLPLFLHDALSNIQAELEVF